MCGRSTARPGDAEGEPTFGGTASPGPAVGPQWGQRPASALSSPIACAARAGASWWTSETALVRARPASRRVVQTAFPMTGALNPCSASPRVPAAAPKSPRGRRARSGRAPGPPPRYDIAHIYPACLLRGCVSGDARFPLLGPKDGPGRRDNPMILTDFAPDRAALCRFVDVFVGVFADVVDASGGRLRFRARKPKPAGAGRLVGETDHPTTARADREIVVAHPIRGVGRRTAVRKSVIVSKRETTCRESAFSALEDRFPETGE